MKEGMIMANNFNWVEIRTRDLERAKRFYEGLFGWKISGKENKDFAYWLIDTGTKPGGGMWRMPEDKPLGILVYILVDDIESTLKKVEELGGKVTIPKSPSAGCFMAAFADPDGNTFRLWEEPKK
ncbi:MAG: VOC family protein [Candidatus Edwardsbacteria bacterium]